MKYVYCLVTNKNKYYTQDSDRYSVVRQLHRATVKNDPDDFAINQREMESYGYRLLTFTDKEYFLKRLSRA